MQTRSKFFSKLCATTLASLSLLLGLSTQAQTTTPNVKVEILGIGASALLGGPLTDPDGNGLDAAGGATDSSWNWAGITSSHEPDFEGAESAFNIFDHKVGGGADKWCCDDPTPGNPVWVAVQFRQPVSITHFTVTSGNDTPTRDPTDWAIQGSNNGTTYTDIYHFFGTTVPWDARNQVVKFTLPFASQAYTYIRYIAYDTPAPLHQLNEIEYFGTVGGAGSAPIKNGLVAYWNFEGNFKDQAGKFDGTEIGSAPIAFVNGKSGFGKSIKMNGDDQYIEISGGDPDDLAFAGGSMSVAAWFKVDAFDTSWQALVAKGEGGNWRIHRRSAEQGMAFTGGPSGDTPTGKDVNDGQWHHLVAITDKDAVAFGTALYIDGVLDTQLAAPQVLAANGLRMRIGDNPGAPSREWEGEIDDVALWDRVLTETEIKQMYANGAGKPISELLGVVVGDADKDGIPDAAELAYGFNPNDPTDAAKDFDKDGVSNLDEYRAGTDPTDVTKPTIAAVAGNSTFDRVSITFSEDLDPATATVLTNYSISPALAVTAATYSRKVVTLTTAKQAPGATAYTVNVKGVRDTSKNEIVTDTKVVFYSYLLTKTGVLKYSYWTNINGTPLDGLLTDPRFPASPSGVGTVFSFDSREFFPTDALENYGASISGFITPATSGNYVFFISSDDNGALFLSTDDKPANKKQIAAETAWSNGRQWTTSAGNSDLSSKRSDEFPGSEWPTGATISLVAGRQYYIEMLYKEGGGGDFGQVAWKRTTDTTPEASLTPIPSSFLSSEVDLPVPAEGSFTTQFPAPNARNVKPGITVSVAHRDGKTVWSATNVTLKFNGVTVTPTFTKAGTLATIEYKPSLTSKSTNTISLSFLDPGGKPATLDWSFETVEFKGPVKDLVKGYESFILGAAALTPDKGGFSGKVGDYAIDYGRGSGQSVLIPDASFLNAATATDQLTYAIWIKKYDIANNSVFWSDSPSSSGNLRGFQAHTPWGDNVIYFDTAGCCDGTTQRISANIDTYANYTGDISWWTNSWHHFAFTKNASRKQVWIDGNLFLEGDSTSPLPTDFARIWLGAEGGGPNAGTANNFHGLQDDFAIFGTALASADIKRLAAGGAPSTLAATTKLIAYWDFNGTIAAAAAKFTKVTRNANGTITLEWTGGGTLEASPSVTGPWQAIAGATSPYTFTPTAVRLFGRIRQ
jgi:hypothetical protein